jgi:DNA-binding winged helix-turn-helix (wHTH) protein
MTVADRSIDVQILRLRRKLEADPGAPRIIQTERGLGYVFVLPVDPDDDHTTWRARLPLLTHIAAPAE